MNKLTVVPITKCSFGTNIAFTFDNGVTASFVMCKEKTDGNLGKLRSECSMVEVAIFKGDSPDFEIEGEKLWQWLTAHYPEVLNCANFVGGSINFLPVEHIGKVLTWAKMC